MTMGWRCFSLLLIAATLGSAVADASASPDNFQALYSYYFPKDAKELRADTRRFFDRLLVGKLAHGDPDGRATIISRALQGDAGAVRRFFRSSDRDGAGEFAETWQYECPLLLLRLGDDRFSELLARENSSTREAVGVALEYLIDWHRHAFPRTRGLYAYRHNVASAELVARRQSPSCAPISLTSAEEMKLRKALAGERRFVDVNVTKARRIIPGTRGRAFIYVWSRYSKVELDALAEFIRQTLNRTSAIQFPR
jgi:hypothetical protein